MVWIQGELSNLARPASGHIYFSLKDRGAQVRCAMFRAKNALINFDLDNGVEVIARARVGMYEARGEYQLIVEHLEAAGDGMLRLKFEELKRKLAAEGLFDESNKYELPLYPTQIGIITSASGAALHDILTTLRRRNPAIPIVIYPTTVQGESAKYDIVNALELANQRDECDVIILARGGGSLEDLWSFNEEMVVRAIFDSEIPIICGVGHEVDFTLADFAADARAPTPTAAAELSAESLGDMLGRLESAQSSLVRVMMHSLKDHQQRLALYRSGVQHPGKRIEQLFQQCDELTTRLPIALRNIQLLKTSVADHLVSKLNSLSPATKIRDLNKDISQHRNRLVTSMSTVLDRKKALSAELSRTLNAVSPNATLSRGYAIISDGEKRIVRDAKNYQPGDELEARLAKGGLTVTVKDAKTE